MCLFRFDTKNEEKYFNQIIKENPKQLYSFESKYANQEKTLFKMYGKVNDLNKKIRLIVIFLRNR